MLQYLETENPVELKEKFKTAIKIVTEERVDPCVIDMLRKELESLAFMTSNIKN